MYANAFVQGPADMLPAAQYQERDVERTRAKALYLRGVELLAHGLELRFPGFGATGLDTLIAGASAADVPLFYWYAAGLLSAWAINPLDLERGIRLPEATTLIMKAYEVEPDYGEGTLDDFFVLYYASLPAELGGDKEKARLHFDRAIEKSRGLSAGPYVSWAQTVAIPAQDYPVFKENLEKALAIKADKHPASRLANLISQRKARYLLDNADLYFIDTGV
jgi:predicted anti-sigma-YlaC factor YlaD